MIVKRSLALSCVELVPVLGRLMQFRLLLLRRLGYSDSVGRTPDPTVMFSIYLAVPVRVRQRRRIVCLT